MRFSPRHLLRLFLAMTVFLAAALPAPAALFCDNCPYLKVTKVAPKLATASCCPSHADRSCDDHSSLHHEDDPGEPASHQSPCTNCPLSCCRLLMPAPQQIVLVATADNPSEPLYFEQTAPLAPAAEAIFHPPRL